MIIQNEEQLKPFIEELYSNQSVAFDLETTGLRPFNGDKIIGHSFFLPSNEQSYYIPIRHEINYQLSPELFHDQVREYFGNQDNWLITWNGKFDTKFLKHEGVEVNAFIVDGMLLAHLNEENEPSFGLKPMAAKYFGIDETAEQTALKQAANEYLAESLNAQIMIRDAAEIELRHMEQSWRAEQKAVYKEALKPLTLQYNRLEKKREKGEELDESVDLEKMGETIATLRGKIADINKRKLKDHSAGLLDFLTFYEARNKAMIAISAIKKVEPMSILAKLDLEIVALYAKQDAVLTYKLYELLRYGSK
jgi:DNA polymerase I-like protein with 3'-5' exonuclease and polymerase domains